MLNAIRLESRFGVWVLGNLIFVFCFYFVTAFDFFSISFIRFTVCCILLFLLLGFFTLFCANILTH